MNMLFEPLDSSLAIAFLLQMMIRTAPARCRSAYWLAPAGASLAAVAGKLVAAGAEAMGAVAMGADAADVSLAAPPAPALSEPRLQPAVSDIAATTAPS